MSNLCEHCGGPVSGHGYSGRPWPGIEPKTYCCYGCLSLGEEVCRSSCSKIRRPQLTGIWIRLAVGFLVVSQSMIFSLGINLEDASRQTKLIVHSGILLATLVVVALLGVPLFRNAWHELRQRRVTVEAMFVLTMIGAMTASMQSLITGVGPIYFEVVSVLLVVYTLGKVLTASSREAAIGSAGVWAGQVRTCRRIDDKGREQTLDIAAIEPGDVVEVRPGETIPVDGIIRQGRGFLSEAPVSGEPFAVVRQEGDRVLAGMASHDATFRIAATSAGTARQMDRLLKAVERARQAPFSMQAQADRLTKLFLPLLLVVAGVTMLIWSMIDSWQVGLFHSMAVLLVACPCALGLATPIVVWSALSRLAERGLIASRGDVIEELARIDRVIFDKTGTLTEDAFGLVELHTAATGEDRARLLSWLSLAQSHSKHPIAQPFARLPRDFPAEVVSLHVLPGVGIAADILADGRTHTLRVGRLTDAPADASGDAKGQRIDIELDGEPAGYAVVAERLRDCVPETLAAFETLGIRAEVLTGDRSDWRTRLDLPDGHSGLLPEDKLRHVRELREAGHRVLMVGDGINDAAALAAANVGVAMSSGTDLAGEAATAVLWHGDLRMLPWAVALSREAVALVRRNLRRAALYNVFGVLLAAFGLLHPVVAALLMVVSSLLVTWFSVRLAADSDDHDLHYTVSTAPGIASDRWLDRAASYATIGGIIHALAFALQAVFLLLLLDLHGSTAVLVSLVFLGGGLLLGRAWAKGERMPHGLDMSLGMLTLGNFGMIAGWYADNGFAPLHNEGCCMCVEAMRDGLFSKPWMWLGMLIAANVGMACLPRHTHASRGFHRLSMYLGGNVGMVAGMFAGGWLARLPELESMASAATLSLVGMTVGMIAGMLLGAELCRRGLVVLDALARIPGWLLRSPEAVGRDARFG